MKHGEMMSVNRQVYDQKTKLTGKCCKLFAIISYKKFYTGNLNTPNMTHHHPTPPPIGVGCREKLIICRFYIILHELNQIYSKTFANYDSSQSKGGYVEKLLHAIFAIVWHFDIKFILYLLYISCFYGYKDCFLMCN